MANLMRCLFCGLLQDEPEGVKACQRCGGELTFEDPEAQRQGGSYLAAQMELDQISAPAGQTVDRYLMVTIRTPETVPDEHLAETASGRMPLGFNMVVDVSGSMHGLKIENTKQALRLAARLLHKGDQVSMTVFSSSAQMLKKPTPVNSANLKVIESIIEELQPGGMTALFEGLDLGLTQAEEMRSGNNLTLLLSDGQANVGETNLEVLGGRAKAAAESGLVTSTLGVGMDYNEALMVEIANQGRGRFYHVQSAGEIVPYLTGELGEAANVAARDVKIHIHLPKGTALIPLSAAYRCEIIKREAVIAVGDIPADLEVEIPLRLTLFSGKADERLSLDGELTYQSPAGSLLKMQINRVTVRFVKQQKFTMDMGVVRPVAARVAEQLQAAQILNFSRSFSKGDPVELQSAEKERERLRQYYELLDKDTRDQLLARLDSDFSAVRSGSPMAKNVVSHAYMTSRSTRNRNN